MTGQGYLWPYVLQGMMILPIFAATQSLYPDVMRKVMLSILTAMACVTMQGQNVVDSVKLKEAARYGELAMGQFEKEQYGKSAELLTRQIVALRQGQATHTADYCHALIMLGKCQYRMKKLPEAIATLRQASEIYGQHVSREDKTYIFILDNLGLYQSVAGQKEEALKNATEALRLYEKLLKHDQDLASILMHVAENLSDLGRTAEALKHELRALSVLRELYGEHSSQYIAELPYLQRYYEEAGRKDKAAEVKDRIATLAEETKQGKVDLPPVIDFKTPAECAQHKQDMLRYCKYYLNHHMSAEHMSDALRYILSWAAVTDMVHIHIGKNESELFATTGAMPYMGSYMAGCAEYALEEDETDFSYDMYAHAMEAVLNHYVANKEQLGEVKAMEKYIKLYRKDSKLLEELLRKNYAELTKEAGQAKTE